MNPVAASPTLHYRLVCVENGHENSELETTTYCTTCGSVLEIVYTEQPKQTESICYPLRDRLPDPIRTIPTELRYLQKISPIYEGTIWAKCEHQNPTGCFKDRGSYIEVLKAKELNRDAICLASTGNMAASVACYASYFGIKCFVFVPEFTSEGKLAQAMIYNAKVIKVKGDYSKCEALCRKFAESGNYYLAGDYVFREEGQKSMSFEVIQQNGTDFDFVFIPVGCGTNFGAIWKGYKEAKAQGLINKLPRLVAVQPEHSSPVVKGIFKKEKVIETKIQTMASAVAASNPVEFYKVLRGIEESDGLAYIVSEEEILESLTEMAKTEGLFTEPACALPLAAFKKYRDVFGDSKCLFVLTGNGLKDTGVVVRHSLPQPVISNDLNAVQKFIKSGYLDIQSNAWGQWQIPPFGTLQLDPEQVEIYTNYVDTFNKRGKLLTEKEQEVIQSMVFDEAPAKIDWIQIMDYDVRLKKNGLVKAKVSLKLYDKLIDGKAEGVGPLHAVLTAIKSVTDAIIPLEVVYHALEVLSPAATSLVVVTLRLNHNDRQFMTKSVSPDIIEAGLKAFIKGLAISVF